ncbi:hypothetical protein L596_026824 [Steinernema carpocapsae]|uniref:G-protein coupled receptors family 1 profile domain-containing protein n=1 Tax=Steinernema carpocapsae TaxID=34508 RepID=A0A4V5ZYA3_STECR|nr:hypothetical protein L596_026824 [Steinernema carpocapsae]
MEDVTFERWLEIAIYATDATSIPLKIFSIYIIVAHTPKHMRQTLLFLLNETVWNLIANLLYCIGDMIPMMPTQCFRFDGLAIRFMDAEFGGHLFFKLVFLSVIQVGCSIALSFQFRYVVICHSARIKNIHRAWGYVYCFCFHLLFSVFSMYTTSQWEISISDYPDQSELSGKANLFCYNPEAKSKLVSVLGLCLACATFIAIAIYCIIKCFLKMYENKKNASNATLQKQNTLFWNFLILAVLPSVMGALPIFAGQVVVYFNHLANAKEIFGIATLILLNHGTVNTIIILYIFKDYRKAVKRIFVRSFSKSNVIFVTTASQGFCDRT